MSGPVNAADAAPDTGAPCVDGAVVEVLEARATQVGGVPVRRLLPKRTRRMVGAWCFVDDFGPADPRRAPMRIGPHPHIGLHTVTWVLEGEVVHRDSLGREQPIRPGQLNLMTAGRGVAHAEETPERSAGTLRGLQLWVAQPEATRHGTPAFEHHPRLPGVDLGDAEATVLLGSLAGAASPARADTPLVAADVRLRGAVTVPLDPTFEHGVAVVEGEVRLDGERVGAGAFAYLGRGRDSATLDGRAVLLLLGGLPFGETITMWWNFVGRSHEELEDAADAWNRDDGRFGRVAGGLARLDAPRPGWRPLA